MFSHDGAYLVIAGAGTTDFVNMTIDMLQEGFEAGVKTFASITRLLKSTIRVVYKDHIGVQVLSLNLTDDKPSVFLIVAARLPDGSLNAWKVSQTSVSRIRHAEFVGIGEDAARSLTTWLYPEPGLDKMSNVQLLVKEIIAETKRICRDVGGATHIGTLPRGQDAGAVWHIPERYDLEFFWGINRWLGGALQAATRKHYSDAAFEAAQSSLASHLSAIRGKCKGSTDGGEWEAMFEQLE